MTLAEEEAFAYERVRYAFPGSALARGPHKRSCRIHLEGSLYDAAEAASAAAAFDGNGERRALWATALPIVSSARQRSGRRRRGTRVLTAVLFPRPGAPHARGDLPSQGGRGGHST